MTTEDKQKLIDSINCKFPSNNLTELYYNVGRALPFTAQRFPRGVATEWYKSQYVQVVRVEPHGSFGKYGKVYGYYYRNGERADSADTPEDSWCKKDDVEPQEIPNSGCGSWYLMDIQGEPKEEHEIRLLGLDDVFTFGKYKDKTIREIVDSDWNYVKWAIVDSQRLVADVEAIVKYHKSNLKIHGPHDVITFGKYKGKTIQYIFNDDIQYLRWLESQNPDFVIDWKDLLSTKAEN